MTAKRVFYIMLGIIVLLSGLVVGGVVLGNLLLQKQGAKLLDLKLQNHVLDAEQDSLSQAKRDIQKYASYEQIAKAVVPQDKDQAQAVREIVSIANDAGISLKTISFPTSNLGAGSSSGSSSSSAAASNTATPLASASTTPTVTQVKPVQGIDGVYSMDIAIQSDDTKPADYYKFLDFLKRLENNRRTAQVTSINIQPTDSKQAINFSITVSVYIKPS